MTLVSEQFCAVVENIFRNLKYAYHMRFRTPPESLGCPDYADDIYFT